MVKVGTKDGLDIYSAGDMATAKSLGGRSEVAVNIKGVNATRTAAQNSSIHLYCGLLAKAFNDGGLDMVKVLEQKNADVSWSMDAVKDVIWKPIQLALFPDKTSTTQLETHEVTKVYEQIARHMASRFNINQSFPSRNGE